jgi:hypothetical protein
MPHFRRTIMLDHLKFSLQISCFALVLCLGGHASAATITAAEYRESLRELYGRYQGVLANRDACIAAFPQSKATTEKAFGVWQTRHRRLIDELDQRFAVMIRAYSKDDKDYSRNFGKYQGDLLRQREEVKQTLLQQGTPELEKMCKDLPRFLQSADSDLEKEFAEDLRIVRQWQLPAK